MKLDEVTGDDKFDRMLGRITGSDEPSIDLTGKQAEPDRRIHELTYKIFLALRDFNDPATTQKFVDFMNKTLGPLEGPPNP